MSRVFEALNKASHEKLRQTDPKLNGTYQLGNERVAFESVSLNGEPLLGTNGHSDQTPVLSTNEAITSKSWREKLEELCFGWDLRRYESHPIVALEEKSSAAEQYKILREQLKRLHAESGIRTIAITSPVKKD
ncbi:MAG: hypothetical protein ACTHLX_15205, partial [Candidatus Binatia bacterium]